MSAPNVTGVVIKENPTYPGYAFGSDGSVWSCRGRGNWKKQKEWFRLKTQRGKEKWCGLSVSVRSVTDKKRSTRMVHRLILEAFVGPCPPGMEACHWNGNPTDNRLENLRWDTPQENTNDKYRHGTMQKGTMHPGAKLTDQKVVELRNLRNEGVSTKRLSEMYGLCQRNVRRACVGDTWKHVEA